MDNDVTKFGSFDVLSDPSIREDLKNYSKWKTYPQVFVNGEFLGGLDILQDMHLDGKLLTSLPEDSFGQVSGSAKLDLIVAEPGVILVCEGTLSDAKNAAILEPLVKLEVPFKIYDVKTGKMHSYKPPSDVSGATLDKAFETVDFKKQALLGSKVAKVVRETHAALRQHEEEVAEAAAAAAPEVGSEAKRDHDAAAAAEAFPLVYVDRKHIGHGAAPFKDAAALKELVKRYLPKPAATTAAPAAAAATPAAATTTTTTTAAAAGVSK